MSNISIVLDRLSLQTRLTELTTAADTSFALVVLAEDIDADTTQSLREAAKLCDIVVAATENKLHTDSKHQHLLRQAGVDVVFYPKNPPLGTYSSGIKKINETFVLQAVLAVMPNLVVVPRSNLTLIRVFRNMQHSFGELFSLRQIP